MVRDWRTEGGLSLIEMVIAMALFALVVGAFYGLVTTGVRAWGSLEGQLEVQQHPRIALGRVIGEIRQARDFVIGSGGTSLGLAKATVLTQDAAAAATSLNVEDASVLASGVPIVLVSVNRQEQVTVSAITGNTLTLTSGLTAAHKQGELVRRAHSTLSGAAASGATAVSVWSGGAFKVGDAIAVGQEGSFTVSAVSGNTLTVSPALAQSHASGEIVAPLTLVFDLSGSQLTRKGTVVADFLGVPAGKQLFFAVKSSLATSAAAGATQLCVQSVVGFALNDYIQIGQIADAQTPTTAISFRAAQSSSGNGVTSLAITKPTGVVDNDLMIAGITVKNTASGISFRSVATATSGSTEVTSLTINKPAGVVDNDVMIAAFAFDDGSNQMVTPPAGWTFVRRTDNGVDVGLAVYRKVASGEPASYTWTISPQQQLAGGIMAYAGVDTANPIDVENGQTTSGTSHSTPSVTTTVSNAMLVTSFAHNLVATFIPPDGMTERFDVASDTTVAGNDVIQATAGATGAKTATSSVSSTGVSHILALRPAAPVSVTITPPAGWTLVRRIDNGTDISLAVYRKVASSEPASYTWTFSASSNVSGGIQAYSGVDTTTPIDVENGQTTASGTSHSTPDVTTTVADAMLVTSFAVSASTTFTPPTGQTERYDVASTGTTSEGDDQAQATAGATGTKTATSATAGPGAAHILALRPVLGEELLEFRTITAIDTGTNCLTVNEGITKGRSTGTLVRVNVVEVNMRATRSNQTTGQTQEVIVGSKALVRNR